MLLSNLIAGILVLAETLMIWNWMSLLGILEEDPLYPSSG
jgi:hypothetical protein